MIQKLTDKPISIAADYRGVVLKGRLTGWLLANGYSVKDLRDGQRYRAGRCDGLRASVGS